ncbi:hypothetical protein [Escherichia phage EC148]|uniref:Tape measure chaperone n=1 Tax=Escherichia phage EC148 TaxID=2936943 RepID=A0A9E7IDL1_9CAUD|nr:hypothetical protein [Escherichia phage EC148]WJN63585.1 hypothetical protein [Escherichia phage SUT_E1520]WLW39139.1 hypothetical protein [Escherichia phage SUT_E420]WLW39276.1 hypothetical protein [Escherichia phage SUT_E520]VUF55622.1 Phage protein [Escherichia phage T5_ev212]
MTKQQYLILCESMGIEPDPKAMPVELEDFPPIVSISMNIYNSLIDCFIPGDFPIFIGKDKAALGVLFDIYGITDPIEKEFVLHIINIFDAKAVDAARKRAEQHKPQNGRIPNVKPHARSRAR